MEFGEVIFYIVIGFIVVFILSKLYKFLFTPTAQEQESHRILKESLDDEYIIDPETGARLTLEEAESGHWIDHDNESRTTPKQELNKLLSNDERQAQIAINYLKASHTYSRTDLSDQQFEQFENTKMLQKYDDWSYSHPFAFEDGLVILPAPELHGMTYYDDDYK